MWIFIYFVFFQHFLKTLPSAFAVSPNWLNVIYNVWFIYVGDKKFKIERKNYLAFSQQQKCVNLLSWQPDTLRANLLKDNGIMEASAKQLAVNLFCRQSCHWKARRSQPQWYQRRKLEGKWGYSISASQLKPY